MRVSSVQCDACCTSHKIEDEYDVANLPPGWFTVMPGQNRGFKENMHFCSLACLRDWAVKEVNPIRFFEHPELLEM
jgi:hypothetical protein